MKFECVTRREELRSEDELQSSKELRFYDIHIKVLEAISQWREQERQLGGGAFIPTSSVYPGPERRLEHMIIAPSVADDPGGYDGEGGDPFYWERYQWNPNGDGPRNYSPERETVLARIEKTLRDVNFPMSIDQIRASFRCDRSDATFFEIYAPAGRITNPLMEALVDLWNYTPRMTLDEWAPIETLREHVLDPDTWISGISEGRTSLIRDCEFVVAPHNEAMLDALDIPEDPQLTVDQLASSLRHARSVRGGDAVYDGRL